MKKLPNIKEEKQEIFKLSDININSFFCIQITKQINYLKDEIKGRNLLNDNDISILNQEINNYETLINTNEGKNVSKILTTFYDAISNLNEIPKQNSDYAKKIKKIIDEYKGPKTITLKYIKDKYNEFYNKDISLITISRILRFHLGFQYRKTKIKNSKLEDINYIIMSYGFIKGIIKAIDLKFNIIYIDECGFQLENNNLRIWRRPGDEIIGGAIKDLKKKINLILAINQNEIILAHYYKNESITSNEFIEFIKDLINGYNSQYIDKTIFICDNAKYHLSKDVKQFLKDQKLKFLFTVPYKSNFNCIELCFNLIKNKLYKEIYKNIKLLEERICFLLDNDEISQNINKIYVKTLKVYKEFYLKNKETIKKLENDKQFFLNKKRIRRKKK